MCVRGAMILIAHGECTDASHKLPYRLGQQINFFTAANERAGEVHRVDPPATFVPPACDGDRKSSVG
jgi:hypothetical protein